MRLSRLYSNKPETFASIDFRSGLNVILAEIRRPENRNKDTHNLGKSTVGRLLDYCFLASRDSSNFLFKHLDRFKDFIFFLEVELPDRKYLTIRRSVEDHSRIAFLKHTAPHQDHSNLPLDEWDHPDVAFDRARELLDSLLDWRDLKPWSYRKGLGYLLRSQDDYRDVFHLRKFAGGHADWKPFLAHILGFNDVLVSRHYQKEKQLAEASSTIKTVNQELGGSIADASKIDGLLLLKLKELEKKQAFLDLFDFRAGDKDQTKELVEKIDDQVAALNARRYSLNQNRKKIVAAMDEGAILFDPDNAQRLFKEAGVLFRGQIKKDFDQLISFNQAITQERRTYLREELAEVDEELRTINPELAALNRRRAGMLKSLTNTDSFTRYKQASSELVTLRADITALEAQRAHLHRLQELRATVRTLTEERVALQTMIEVDVDGQNTNAASLFSQVRLYFSEIIEDVIDRKALLSVSTNQQGHLAFNAHILDEAGNTTSADLGTTYRKLLCIAFDMAVLRAHSDTKFPRFAYHDGVFESLEWRKRVNLLKVIRQYNTFGIQSIITLIDTDMPKSSDIPSILFLDEAAEMQELEAKDSPFDENEIILLLHDEDVTGLLFQMQPW